jgi:23S rRNA (uracil1939-C5)-methyltransferase
MKKWKKNDELTLLIDDMGTQGEGIGHADGYALFVKGALVGEKVRVRLTKLNKNYGFARLLEVLETSPFRTVPECPHAGPCGGCTLQHMTYEGQLAFKEKKVRDCLERIGGVNMDEVEWLPVLGMDDAARAWHYRNKAQFPVREDADGKAVAGFFADRSHRIIPVSSCKIQHPIINEVTVAVTAFLNDYGISVYNEEKHRGLVRHIYVRRGFYSGQIMVCLVINGTSLPHADEFIRCMREFDGMTSICLNINREKTNVILGQKMVFLWGSQWIEDRIGDTCYRISPQSFYQVNPVQTQKLYETALAFADLQGDEKVWDLYCGIGTISLYLAQHLSPEKGGRVIGVEIVPAAIENAKENARINDISHADFYCGAAEMLVPEFLSGDTYVHADVVVVDPPRKGCDEKLLDAIVQILPEKIVYVSCDPATLARDVKFFSKKGYAVKKVRVCDQFCQGWHVETVCLLSRKAQ